MKLATIIYKKRLRLAVIDHDGAIDINEAVPEISSDLRVALQQGSDLLRAGRAALSSPAPRIAQKDFSFAPLIPEPGKVVCLGLNYFEHAKEGGRTKPDYPWFFLRCSTSLLAHEASVIVPRVSDKLDYEAELAVVVGKAVPRHVSSADALDYVFGYSCFNDVSVRDYQKRTPQWTIGKIFDGTGPFGPHLVTSDSLPRAAAGLRIQCRVNGQVLQDANTDDMIFGVAETISLLSQAITLLPGDVIAMGTPSGVGQSRTPPLFLKSGDSVEVEIEGVGILKNGVRDED